VACVNMLCYSRDRNLRFVEGDRTRFVERVCVTFLPLVGAHGGRGLIGLLDFDLRASALRILCNLHAISTTL
jgi:hypothetical protein